MMKNEELELMDSEAEYEKLSEAIKLKRLLLRGFQRDYYKYTIDIMTAEEIISALRIKMTDFFVITYIIIYWQSKLKCIA